LPAVPPDSSLAADDLLGRTILSVLLCQSKKGLLCCTTSNRSLVFEFDLLRIPVVDSMRDVVACYDKTSVFDQKSPTRCSFGKARAGGLEPRPTLSI
jgi:hypothetical protein